MDITPDLSHLSNEERKIIQAVISRQKAEEILDGRSENNNDYSIPSIAISSRHYSQLNESGVICQICQKTKFVNEQSSRQCSVCKKRFCVRCGIRLKSQTYLCNQCRQKQEQYFSLTPKNICKQYSSDYILSQTSEENPMNKYGANQKRILPKPKLNQNDEDVSSPESISTCDKKKRLLPEIRQDILRDFQYHSLEERDLGQESTLKDSGIDTASSSTILNVISSEQFKKVFILMLFCLVYV
jgi:regulating synaptic membrane exocytosis protein 2